MSDLVYEDFDAKPKKSRLGKKTMHWLAYKYLELQSIELDKGEVYDANKISKGLSKLYNESKKDPDETYRRMKLGSEYFKKDNLDWTPEAVWRNWEKIKKWHDDAQPAINDKYGLYG